LPKHFIESESEDQSQKLDRFFDKLRDWVINGIAGEKRRGEGREVLYADLGDASAHFFQPFKTRFKQEFRPKYA